MKRKTIALLAMLWCGIGAINAAIADNNGVQKQIEGLRQNYIQQLENLKRGYDFKRDDKASPDGAGCA